MVGGGRPGDWRAGGSLWGVVRQARASARARGLPLGSVLGGIDEDGADDLLGQRSLGASGRPSAAALRRASFSRGRGASSIVESVIEEGDEEAETAVVEALDRVRERRECCGGSASETPSREESAGLGGATAEDARGHAELGGNGDGEDGGAEKGARRDRGGERGKGMARGAVARNDERETPGDGRRGEVLSLRFRGASDGSSESSSGDDSDPSSRSSRSFRSSRPSRSSSSSSSSRSAAFACPSAPLRNADSQDRRIESENATVATTGMETKAATEDSGDEAGAVPRKPTAQSSSSSPGARTKAIETMRSAGTSPAVKTARAEEGADDALRLPASSSASTASPAPAPDAARATFEDVEEPSNTHVSAGEIAGVEERRRDDGARAGKGATTSRVDEASAATPQSGKGEGDAEDTTKAPPKPAQGVSPPPSARQSTVRTVGRPASKTPNRPSAAASRSPSFASAARAFTSSLVSSASANRSSLARTASVSAAGLRSRSGSPAGPGDATARAATARIAGNRPAFGSSMVDEVRSGSGGLRTSSGPALSRQTSRSPNRTPSWQLSRAPDGMQSRQLASAPNGMPSRQPTLARSTSRSANLGESAATCERPAGLPTSSRTGSTQSRGESAEVEDRRTGTGAERAGSAAFRSAAVRSREVSRSGSDDRGDSVRATGRRASGPPAGTSRAASAGARESQGRSHGAERGERSGDAGERGKGEVDEASIGSDDSGMHFQDANSDEETPRVGRIRESAALGSPGAGAPTEAGGAADAESREPPGDLPTSMQASSPREGAESGALQPPSTSPSPQAGLPPVSDASESAPEPPSDDPPPASGTSAVGDPNPSRTPIAGQDNSRTTDVSQTPGPSEPGSSTRGDRTPRTSATGAPPPAPTPERDGAHRSKHRSRRHGTHHGHHRSKHKHRGEGAPAKGENAGEADATTTHPLSPPLSSAAALVCSHCDRTVTRLSQSQQLPQQPVKPPEPPPPRSHCPTCGVAILRRRRLPPPPTPPASLAALARAVGAAPRLKPPGIAPPPSLGEFLRACGLRANVGDAKRERLAAGEGGDAGEGTAGAEAAGTKEAAKTKPTSGAENGPPIGQVAASKGRATLTATSPPAHGAAKPSRPPASAAASTAALASSALAASTTAPALLLPFGPARAARRLGVPTVFLGVSRRSADGPSQGVTAPAACEAPRLSLPRLAQGAGRTLEVLRAGKGHAAAAKALEMWEREVRGAAGGDVAAKGAGEGAGAGAASRGRRAGFAAVPVKRDAGRARKDAAESDGCGREATRSEGKRGAKVAPTERGKGGGGGEGSTPDASCGGVEDPDARKVASVGKPEGRRVPDSTVSMLSTPLDTSSADSADGTGAKRVVRAPLPSGRHRSVPTSHGSTPRIPGGHTTATMAATGSAPTSWAAMPDKAIDEAGTSRAGGVGGAGSPTVAGVAAAGAGFAGSSPQVVGSALGEEGGLPAPPAAPSSSVPPTPSVPPSSSVPPTPSVPPSSSVPPTPSVPPSSSVPPTPSVPPSFAAPPAPLPPGVASSATLQPAFGRAALPRTLQGVSRESDARVAAAVAVLAGLLSAATRDCPALFDAASLAWSVAVGSLSSVVEAETRARRCAESRLAAAEAAALAARRAARGCAAALERAVRAEAEVKRLRGAIERIEGPLAGRTLGVARMGGAKDTIPEERRGHDGKEREG